MSAENCQICGKTKDVNVAGHCQGHESASGGASAASQSLLTGVSLKDQLDAIPTPSKLANPAPGASPVAGAGAGAPIGQSASTTRAPQMAPNMAAQDPAAMGGAPAAQAGGEVPEWMRKFQAHQSEIMPAQGGSSSGGIGNNASLPTSNPWSSSNSSTDLPAQSSSYTVMIGAIVLICVIMFAYMMMNKPPAATLPTTSSPTSTPTAAPTSAVPGSAPGAVMPGTNTPGTTYPTTYPGTTNPMPVATPAPSGYPPQITPSPVPGAPATTYPPQISPNPVPGSPDPALSPNPVPGTPSPSPNPVPGTPDPNAAAPNPVPGNNP